MITTAEKIGLVRTLMGEWLREDVVDFFEVPENAEDRVVFSVIDNEFYRDTFGLFIKCLHLGIISLTLDPDDKDDLVENKFEFIINDEYKELLMVYYL